MNEQNTQPDPNRRIHWIDDRPKASGTAYTPDPPHPYSSANTTYTPYVPGKPLQGNVPPAAPVRRKRKKKTPWWFYVVFTLLVGVIIYSGVNIGIAQYRYSHNQKVQQGILELFFSTESSSAPGQPAKQENSSAAADESDTEQKLPEYNFDAVLAVNPDVVGWIYIPSVGVNNIVVQSYDNDYYLHRNLYKDYEYAGTFYLDYRTFFDETDICILYGHSMADGSMFGQLRKLFQQPFADENPVFWYYTPEHVYRCDIISTYLTTVEENYARFDFADPEDRLDFLRELEAKSSADFPDVDYDEDSRFLMISTCNYSQVWDDGRQPLIAKITMIS